MQRHEHPSSQSQPHRFGWLQSHKMALILLGFLAVGAFFLLTEQAAHALGLFPYAVFLLCPLMMLFMHGEHKDHAGHDLPHDEPPRGGQQ